MLWRTTNLNQRSEYTKPDMPQSITDMKNNVTSQKIQTKMGVPPNKSTSPLCRKPAQFEANQSLLWLECLLLTTKMERCRSSVLLFFYFGKKSYQKSKKSKNINIKNKTKQGWRIQVHKLGVPRLHTEISCYGGLRFA